MVKPKWTPQKCFCSGLHITLCNDTKLRTTSGCITTSLLATPKGRTNKNRNGWALLSGTPLFLALTRHQHHEKETKQETSVYRMTKKKPTKRLHKRRATSTKGPSMIPQNQGAVLKDVMQLGYLTGHRWHSEFRVAIKASRSCEEATTTKGPSMTSQKQGPVLNLLCNQGT